MNSYLMFATKLTISFPISPESNCVTDGKKTENVGSIQMKRKEELLNRRDCTTVIGRIFLSNFIVFFFKSLKYSLRKRAIIKLSIIDSCITKCMVS